LVDGSDIREYKIADFRSQFSIVLQEPVLFSTSIEENIAYGKPTASKKEIHAAAKDAYAHGFISNCPDGYLSKVGERGMQLSGGERQRISIARAFLKNSPLLILDEPTSSVDIRTESLIMNATRKLMEGKTTFFITHRLDALSHCDLVIHLEKGKIIDIIYNDHPEWLNNKINSFREKAI
jgi:ATP-binding cassette subfamily B protein